MNFKASLKNFKVLFDCITKIDKSLYGFLTVNIVFSALKPFPYIIVSKFIFDLFVNGSEIKQLIWYALALVGSSLIINELAAWSEASLQKRYKKFDFEFFKLMCWKSVTIDYALRGETNTKQKEENAAKAINGMNATLAVIAIKSFCINTVILIGTVSIVARINLWLLLIVVLTVIIDFLVSRKAKKEKMNRDFELWQYDRKEGWFVRFCAMPQYAKDIRLNTAQDFILSKLAFWTQKRLGINFKMIQLDSVVWYISAIMLFVKDLAVYIILGWQILRSQLLTVGDFTMTAGAIDSFKTSLFGIMDAVSELRIRIEYFSQFSEFMEFDGDFKLGKRLPAPKEDVEIRFENVSFQYPGSDKFALKDVNSTITANRSYAVVGENGAGKTTFITLLCRLFDPTQGRITMNGIDIRDIAYEEYLNMFSVVFQDYAVFTTTLLENITMRDVPAPEREETEKRVNAIATGIALDGTIAKLRDGLDALLISEFDDTAVDLSGGETQKVAIARALYKQTPICILDEPTAALDPLAESKIYQTVNDNRGKQTLIFISHRLSSTQFCDEIFVFENGGIAQQGTHQELSQTGGIYSTLFEAQAKYYREDSSISQ